MLEAFVRDLEAVIARQGQPGALVEEVRELLAGLLGRADWLAPRYRRPLAGRPYSQYPLHLGAGGSLCVVSFVWPAGSQTPVHDHCTWGVVGVYRGEETETRYRLVGGDREGDRAELREEATSVMRPGETSIVLPPDDIHRVANRGGETAVSIHVYGADIGRHPRHAFAPDRGTVKRFVSGYDEPKGG